MKKIRWWGAVLGHFVFVFIHPSLDGNGRIGRFLMNLLLIAAGCEWTIIRVEHRERYLAALEEASTRGEHSTPGGVQQK